MRENGKLVYSIGASRSGKTQFVINKIMNNKRLLIWDIEGEYSANSDLQKIMKFITVKNKNDLLNILVENQNDARICYQAQNLKEFEFFTRCAFNWSKQSPATIVCEELANATNAGKAVGSWGILIARGLKYGTDIYGVIQRGQEGDKSSMGNASTVNICRPNTIKDAKYMADTFGLPLSDIPNADCEMLQRHKDRTTEKSKIIFKNELPVLEKIKNFSGTW